MFDPKTNKYPYPLETDRHYLEIHKDRGLVFDANYPYIDKSGWFKFKQNMTRVFLNVIVFPVATVRLGLKIEGRENLKKHKDVLDGGVISVCNHVHMWDYIGVMKGIRPRRSGLLAWAPNINGENGTLIRMVGGIPIPENTVAGQKAFLKAVSGLLEEHGWLHIYAEGSMWEYYRPIRPFKRGASLIAVSNDKPIIPLGYSYREDREKDLTIRANKAVCALVGIDPDKNIYEPEFNDSKRIDYYTAEYGVGYKGSW